MITGTVLARNEERNIVDCLQALRPHVAEILLIDMESADRTVELAQPYVDKVLRHPVIADFDAARNIAIQEARFDWLWFVDADERVPEKTGQLVNDLVRERGDEVTAITIPFKSYFCGKWIQHCGWWPGYTMPRVLKRGHFRFSERLHEGVQFDGGELRLPPDPELAIEHFSYASIEQYVEKFNRYTTNEARYLAERAEQVDWESAIRAMMRDLWLYYERNQGSLDGEHGWILSWLAGQYRWFAHAKLLDIQQQRNGDLSPGDVGRGGRSHFMGHHGEFPGPAFPPNLDAVIQLMESELAALRASNPRLPLGIVWRSPIWDPSGYADESRVMLKSLADGERPLAVEEMRWSDRICALPDEDTRLLKTLTRCKRPPFVATITNCIPSLPFCRPDPGAAVNVLRTTFETDRIPPDWLPKIELFDEVWVPCKANQLSFRRAGVPPEKLRILPEYVDMKRFTPRGKTLPLPGLLKDRFVFLSVFDWQLRKGWDVLLGAYCGEFSTDDGVGLLLKISTVHGHSMDSVHREADAVLKPLSQSLDGRPDIVIWNKMLDAADFAALYRGVDAFVLASRGEGWGRPYMEAMASGLPTIGTRGSGNDDFMNDKNSFLISTRLVDVPDAAAAEIPVYAGHRWLEPHVDELRSAMRQVLRDEAKRKSIVRKAVADLRAGFSPEHAREAVEENLRAAEERFRSTPPPEVDESRIRVELEGEFFARHSFSIINEKLSLQFMRDPALALSLRRVRHNPTYDEQAEFAHRLGPYMDRVFSEGARITIRHAFPPNWEPPATGKWVHIQPWEFGVLPLDWVEPLRERVDEIWAPSSYVKHVYERSGIAPEKIQVIPWGVEPDIFDPEAPPLLLPTERRFIFLFVGGTIPRKGFDLVFEAYLSEFRKDEDVCLVVKDMGADSFYRFGNFRQRILETMESGQSPEIVYIDANLTEGQLASLYTACDCLVAPYRGEGFGLPILEAMACGLPPIVPRGGASDDFVSESTAYLLAAEEVECQHDWRLCGVPTQLSVETADARAAMRRAYEDRKETRRKGKRASKYVRDRFTWTATACLMARRLERLARRDRPSPSTSKSQPPRTAIATRTPSITLCMLAQNNEKTIGDSLGRVRPFVSEAIVLDLGSEDRCRDVAIEYDARVYEGEPTDDFSRLRNATISRATSEWILVLDADELMDQQAMREIHGLLGTVSDDVLGARLRIRDGEQEKDLGSREGEVRLFRNHNEIVFSFRGGRQVEPGITRLGGRIIDTDVEIGRAAGSDGSLPCYRDPETLLKLLHLDLAEHPNNPTVLHGLGTMHYRRGDHFHAECYLNDCLRQLEPGDPRFRVTALRLVDCHVRKGDISRAREVAELVRERVPDDAHFQSELTKLLPLTGE